MPFKMLLLGLFIQNTANKSVCFGLLCDGAACDGARVINVLSAFHMLEIVCNHVLVTLNEM